MGASSMNDGVSVHDMEKTATNTMGQPLNNDEEKQLPPPSTIEAESPPNDDATTIKDLEAIGRVTSVGLSLHTTASEDYNKRPKCFSNTLQEALFVLTTTMAVAQASILIGVVGVISSHIGDDLKMTQAEITWITASSSLGAGCFLLFFGRVADLFGRRWLLLASMAAFAVCCLIAGFATNPYYMDVFMGIIGLCSSGAVPPAIGLLGTIYKRPSARKNKAFACFSAGNPLGFVTGMIISGVSFKVANWRTSFWVTAFIYAVFTVIAFFTVPKDDTPRAPFNMETLKKFDYLGALLAVAGIALFTSALSIAGDAPHGWKTAYVIALLILGFALIIGFVVWQGVFKYPLMPLYIWKDKNFSLLVLILTLGFMGFSGNSFWLCLYFQEVQNVAPLGVAARMLPMAIVGVLVNVVAGFIMHIVSNKVLMSIGAVSFCGCFALLTAMPGDAIYWAFIFPALCLSVIGADFQFTVVNMYVMSSLPPDQQSIAGAILQTATRIITSIGLGLSTAAFTSLSPNGSTTSKEYHPYQGIWWVGLASSGLALVFLPFLTIQKQGHGKSK